MRLLKGILAKEALVVFIVIVIRMCWELSQKVSVWSPISWLNARQSFAGWNMLLHLVGLSLRLNQTPRPLLKHSK
ncbi:hypothetical protein GIB67_032544 [Kingdonia uniflora]|uniref:Uncharacterized protein n=1 Tax=Kingdonia uniflora TaxID=39325 RepID=A0A7J7L7W6_9MAGN|nr:hypothetical protein GIB67_032544 [Kingdonia uniflora]